MTPDLPGFSVSLCNCRNIESIIVDKIDSNKDDFVSEEELELWIKNVQNRHMFENVEHQWNEFDLNKDGLISWEEYRNVTYGSYL
ncbi:hypothetical protein AMECASPLE_039357, partial [Ameca splendens]